MNGKNYEVPQCGAFSTHTTINIMKEKPDLRYGCETWDMDYSENSPDHEIKCFRRTADYTRMDQIWNCDIYWELAVVPVLNYLEN